MKRLSHGFGVVLLVAAFVVAGVACPCRQAVAAWRVSPGSVGHACCDDRATAGHASGDARHGGVPGCGHCGRAELGQAANAPALPMPLASLAASVGPAVRPVVIGRPDVPVPLPDRAERSAGSRSLLLVKHSLLI